MKLTAHAFSDIGLVRERNEDSFLADPDLGLFAVADGVGGVPGGDLASRTAMESLDRIVRETPGPPDHTAWVVRMNDEVGRAGRQEGYGHRIASTLTLMDFGQGEATLAHVGDSGAFRIRGDQIERLSDVHNIESEAKARGDSIDRIGRYRFAITRCLGMKEPIIPQIRPVDCRTDDLFLLATDGMTDLIKAREYIEMWQSEPEPAVYLETLLQRCKERGAHDNITAVAVRIDAL